MADRQLHGVIQYLRRIVASGDAATLSDGQLLERFVTQHDEAAFELLVWRHSKMVWRLPPSAPRPARCRRCVSSFVPSAGAAGLVYQQAYLGGRLALQGHLSRGP